MNSIRRPFLEPARSGRRAVLLLVGLGAASLLAWFAYSSLGSSGGENRPLRYTEAIIGSPDRINPLFVHLNDADRDLATLVFSGLTRLGPAGEVQPDLAQSWDISADGRTVTFHLRDGVYWHNGERFTAQDVVFTYNTLANPVLEGDPDQLPLWRQVHCEAPDDLTVSCVLPAPFAPFLAFASVGILPRHILEAVPAQALADNPFNQNPIGTGPYRLSALDQTHAVLVANGSYHLGRPLIDEIEFLFFPDLPTATAAVLSGDADGILLPETAAGSEELRELGRDGSLQRFAVTRGAYTALYLNNSAGALNEPEVRQAIAHAVDVDSIVGEILGGSAAVATSPIPPATWAHNDAVEPYSHDDALARELLDEAGWTMPEGGRVRTRGDLELAITLHTDEDPVREAIADRIAEELRDVGFGVEVVHEDSSRLVRDILLPRQYDAAIFGWDPGPDPDPYPAWHSSQATGNGRNIADYRNDQVDRLLEQGRRTYDPGERRERYLVFQQLFHDDVASLLLYYPVYNYFLPANMRDVALGALVNTGSRFANVHQWRIEEGPLAAR